MQFIGGGGRCWSRRLQGHLVWGHQAWLRHYSPTPGFPGTTVHLVQNARVRMPPHPHTFLSPPSTFLHSHFLNLCSCFLSSASYSR